MLTVIFFVIVAFSLVVPLVSQLNVSDASVTPVTLIFPIHAKAELTLIEMEYEYDCPGFKLTLGIETVALGSVAAATVSIGTSSIMASDTTKLFLSLFIVVLLLLFTTRRDGRD
jgi:hypothetical protein